MMDCRELGSEIKMPLDGREPLEVLNILVRATLPECEQLGCDWILEANGYLDEGAIGVKCVRAPWAPKPVAH